MRLFSRALSRLMVAVVCLGLAACGGKSDGPLPLGLSLKARMRQIHFAEEELREALFHGHVAGDGDDDDRRVEGHPRSADDYPVSKYGHSAARGDSHAIAALVKRYYAAAASGDAAAACRLIYPALARNPALRKVVPKDRFSRPVYPHVRAGETCAQVASNLFVEHHQSLVTDVKTLQVLDVRVSGTHSVALLGFRTAPERWLPVVRTGHRWRVDAFLAGELP
jgi:hypothetical protein